MFASGLTRRFGALIAVDRLDLSIPPGTIFGLLSSNGAGKSTTSRCSPCSCHPAAGRRGWPNSTSCATFATCASTSATCRRCFRPTRRSRCVRNLDLSAKLYGIPRVERRARIAEALSFMELSDVGDVLVRKYSGGMIRRLEIAQALLHRPAVLFLDEPTVGLDPVARQAVWERLADS